MTPRERVWKALNHEEPDRVPVDLGGNSSGMTDVAYKRLVEYLGIKDDTATFTEWRTVAYFDDRVLEFLNIDIREMRLESPQGYKPKIHSDGTIENEWSMIRKNVGYYSEIVRSPLEGVTVKDLDSFSWPNPNDPGRVAGLQEKARKLSEETDCAIKLTDPMNLFNEMSYMLRGFEQFMIDLTTNPKFVFALVEKELELLFGFYGSALEAVGKYIQIVETSDDYGTQSGPMISPSVYRKYFKKAHRKLNEFIKSKTKAKIFLHSCGSVREFIKDFIEVGVEVLNPIQPLAKNMVPEELKKEFGKDICFHGGIDIQQVLPRGTSSDVEQEVKTKIKALAPGGGYILAPAHHIQPDTPPENVVTLYKFAHQYGQYPINYD